MAETDNIARMASMVSDEIFKVFGWKRAGAVNQNWSCVSESHERPTHPSDVVLWYDDPYRAERIFWNVDLKSYAAGTITKAKIAGAIASLARAVECANVSSNWQQRYADDEKSFRCDGLLFVYNHDGEYDGNFARTFGDVDASTLRLPAKRRIAVIGPTDVSYLVNVAQDIVSLRGKERIPLQANGTEFWYPDLVRPRHRVQSESAASIEMLTGPWITLRTKPEHHGGRLEFFVWYRDRGDTVEEFKYLLDSFFRFQMLAFDSQAEVHVRLVDPAPLAISNFAKAKSQISGSLYGFAHDRLTRVDCESIPNVTRRFSEDEVGMEIR